MDLSLFRTHELQVYVHIIACKLGKHILDSYTIQAVLGKPADGGLGRRMWTPT